MSHRRVTRANRERNQQVYRSKDFYDTHYVQNEQDNEHRRQDNIRNARNPDDEPTAQWVVCDGCNNPCIIHNAPPYERDLNRARLGVNAILCESCHVNIDTLDWRQVRENIRRHAHI